MIGSGLTIFALGVYVYQQTHTASSYALILLCVFMQPFLLKPFGGILADRYDRRLMMLIGDLGATLGLLFILFMMLKGDIQLWQIYLGIATSSTFYAFQEPAFKALVTDLLPEDFEIGADSLPITEGKVHFIRQVKGDGTISVLNEDFDVGESLAYEYVWATIDTKQEQLKV